MTLAEALAQHFKAHPGEWLNGLDLGRVAGSYAWRSRCAELRKPPFSMQIDNRQEHHTRPDGSRFTLSLYRYVVASGQRGVHPRCPGCLHCDGPDREVGECLSWGLQTPEKGV